MVTAVCVYSLVPIIQILQPITQGGCLSGRGIDSFLKGSGNEIS